MSSDMTDLAPAESILSLFGLLGGFVVEKWYIPLIVGWLGLVYPSLRYEFLNRLLS